MSQIKSKYVKSKGWKYILLSNYERLCAKMKIIHFDVCLMSQIKKINITLLIKSKGRKYILLSNCACVPRWRLSTLRWILHIFPFYFHVSNQNKKSGNTSNLKLRATACQDEDYLLWAGFLHLFARSQFYLWKGTLCSNALTIIRSELDLCTSFSISCSTVRNKRAMQIEPWPSLVIFMTKYIKCNKIQNESFENMKYFQIESTCVPRWRFSTLSWIFAPFCQ